VQPEEMAVDRQQLGKHVLLATNTYAKDLYKHTNSKTPFISSKYGKRVKTR
jgi:hypothetical protein